MTVGGQPGEVLRLRASSRLIAGATLDRRLDACRRFGVERSLEDDPVGRFLGGRRDRLGVRETTTAVPLGVVGIEECTKELLADALADGNAVAAAGMDSGDLIGVRSALMAAGLPEDGVVGVDKMPQVELDALRRVSGELLLAERVGTDRHVYIDAQADENHATYVAVNAISHHAADTIVFHLDFPAAGVNDIVTAARHLGEEPKFVQSRTSGEAVEIIDRCSSGAVETIMTTNLRVLHDFLLRVDAAAICVNVSPAFVTDAMLERTTAGLTRSRLLLEGEGQTKPFSPEEF